MQTHTHSHNLLSTLTCQVMACQQALCFPQRPLERQASISQTLHLVWILHNPSYPLASGKFYPALKGNRLWSVCQSAFALRTSKSPWQVCKAAILHFVILQVSLFEEEEIMKLPTYLVKKCQPSKLHFSSCLKWLSLSITTHKKYYHFKRALEESAQMPILQNLPNITLFQTEMIVSQSGTTPSLAHILKTGETALLCVITP